jgi:hypothetical protein
MGKDVDGACCESCRLFGGDSPTVPEPPPPPAPVGVSHHQVKIIVQERGGETREVIPAGPEVRVGRVSDNDIVVRDSALSKRQFRFLFKDNKVFVQDLKSTCGTYVNGRKVSSAEIDESSTIHVGNVTMRIQRA